MLELGKWYIITSDGEYRNAGDVGQCISNTSPVWGISQKILKFYTRNKTDAPSWTEPWNMYAPNFDYRLCTEDEIPINENTLGNFPKREGVI